jgi:hypothetical protein
MSAPVADDRVRSISGPVLFARYAYPPNALGYCGPSDSEALRNAAEIDDRATVAQLAKQFEGAWPYLQLIAACNHIVDPLDRRVVDAYWVGNELLTQIPAMTFAASLDDRFARRAGRNLDEIASAAVTLGALAHHSFHVFAVYPWLGLLRGGMEGTPLTVLDRCRIRWGTVEAIVGDLVVVRARHLVMSGSILQLAEAESEVARRSVDGDDSLAALAPGDVVSLHWDWICERLNSDALNRLVHVTTRNLAAVNALERPGPAVITDRLGGGNPALPAIEHEI